MHATLPADLSRQTLEVHAGRAGLDGHVPTLELSSTFPLPDPAAATDSLDALARGEGPGAGGPVYARLHNPTVARFEEALARLEGAEAAVAFSSGMAAVTALLLDARSRGGHVVAVRPLYGGSDHLLRSGLLGLEVDFCAPEAVGAHLRPDTALVLVETPANPTLRTLDIADIVAQAGGVPVAVDNTFLTPVLQRPLEQGATFVLHSATKFLGGHGDVVGGVIACAEEAARGLRQVRVITGAILHPLAGYLLHRGLQTLGLRVRAAQASAARLATRLAAHPAVACVHYPGLPGQDPAGLLGRQMDGPGAIVAFELHSEEEARALMAALRLITPAVSLGSVDTLLQHPASLTHRVVSPEAQAEGGLRPGLVRMSVGIEAEVDLWADLSQALAQASPGALAAR